MRDKKMHDAISKHGRPCLSTQFLNTEKRVENTFDELGGVWNMV